MRSVCKSYHTPRGELPPKFERWSRTGTLMLLMARQPGHTITLADAFIALAPGGQGPVRYIVRDTIRMMTARGMIEPTTQAAWKTPTQPLRGLLLTDSEAAIEITLTQSGRDAVRTWASDIKLAKPTAPPPPPTQRPSATTPPPAVRLPDELRVSAILSRQHTVFGSQRPAGRPGSLDASRLPSRTGDRYTIPEAHP